MKPAFTAFFLAFTILYVYRFQPFVLETIQYAWSGGKTHYDPLIGAAIITTVMGVLSAVTALFTRLPQRLFALNFFPAFLALGLLTAVHVSGTTVSTSLPWLLLSPLMLAAFALLANAARRFQPFLVPLRSTTFLSQPWWTNALAFMLMALTTYAMGNTDRTLHTRLAAEHHARRQLYAEALDCGFPQYDNDSSLTMLRAMALARRGELGERLFRYNVTGASRALLPQPDRSSAFLLGDAMPLWRTIGFVPRDLSEPVADIMQREIRRGTARPAARDYLLCAHLLDGDLTAFAEALPRFYAINDSLPQHYREALVQHTYQKHTRNTPETCQQPYHDAAMEADYADFLALTRKFHAPTLRDAALRDAYFGTYWYYFCKAGH